MANVKIRETLHHGDYRNVRTVEVYKLTSHSLAGVLMSSAYVYLDMEPERLKRMISELETTGLTQLGWSDFEIVKD